jgi:hypothetical protein
MMYGSVTIEKPIIIDSLSNVISKIAMMVKLSMASAITR